MSHGDLAKLAQLTGMAFEAAESKLAVLRREEAELRRQIAALSEAHRVRAAGAVVTDPALRAGVDLRWEGWIEHRAAALTAELARVLARIEAAREELALAFGRREATSELTQQSRSLAQARRLRSQDNGV